MPKKTTLKGQFLRTSLAMLVLSLLIGVAVMVAVMIFFTVRVPDGEKFLMESLSFLFGKQTIGPSRMVPVLVLAGVLLCLMVTGVCILLTSRLTGRITATLKTLRQAADNLRDGELDFQILSCDERELDELSHSLESVRPAPEGHRSGGGRRPGGAGAADGQSLPRPSHPHHRHQGICGGDSGRHCQYPGKAAPLPGDCL